MAKWPYCTSQWKKLRLVKLAQCPVCHICDLRGETVEANTVDHVLPVSQGGPAFPALDGLMALCERCHNEKTSGFDRVAGSVTGRRFKGCDANGNPTDPADGWFEGEGGGGRDH